MPKMEYYLEYPMLIALKKFKTCTIFDIKKTIKENLKEMRISSDLNQHFHINLAARSMKKKDGSKLRHIQMKKKGYIARYIL